MIACFAVFMTLLFAAIKQIASTIR